MALLGQVVSHIQWVITTKLHPWAVEFQYLALPIVVYWIVAVFYDFIDHLDLPAINKYKITRLEKGRDNPVSKRHVVMRVLLQHTLQFLLTAGFLFVDPHNCDVNPPSGWVKSCAQFIIGMFVMDTWQFWIHRLMHVNTTLYKNIHSIHHQLLIPYAYGALYNHPLEALLLDTLGAVVTHYAVGFSCQLGTWLFCFAQIKTVLDHCGYRFPVNPLHDVFPNSAAYHDVHHDFKNIKSNYSQPFFTHWDWLMGSYIDPVPLQLTPEQVEKTQTTQADSEAKKAQ